MPLLVVPNNEVGVWPAYVVTGKAAATLLAGDVVETTDPVAGTWNKTATPSGNLHGVVLRDATKASYLVNEVVPIMIFGVAVLTVDAAVAEGSILQQSDATAGQVEDALATNFASTVANDTSMEFAIGKALTTGGTNAKLLVLVG